MQTTQATCSSAEICRQQGWLPGTMLRGFVEVWRAGAQLVPVATEHGEVPTARYRETVTRSLLQIRITAVGERVVVARLYSIDGIVVDGTYDEVLWDLHTRDWEAA